MSEYLSWLLATLVRLFIGVLACAAVALVVVDVAGDGLDVVQTYVRDRWLS